MELKIFKVGSKSEPAKLAGAIAGTINEGDTIRLECIGAGAISAAVKGVATARGFLISSGIELSMQPHFRDVDLDGETKTSVAFNILTYES